MSEAGGPLLVVVGSMNTDYTVLVDHFPAAGETVLGTGLHVATGGKGANQAVAAARLGAPTFMIGAVGSDPQGRRILADLEAAAVDVSAVAVSSEQPSGTAFISVTPDGQNTIIVASGANFTVDPAASAYAAALLLGQGGLLVMQAELPAETVDVVTQAAAGRGARIVVNQAPFRPLSEPTLRLCDPLIVNAGEAGALLGLDVATAADAATAAALLARTCRSVIVTLGADGCVIAASGFISHLPAAKIDVVDSSGAGDAFVGALAARLLRNRPLIEAAQWATAAAAAAVSSRGANAPHLTVAALKPFLSSLLPTTLLNRD